MAKGWLKNLLKGLMNNGFYMSSNGKWSAYNNFSKTGLPTEDVVGDDAASFPGLDSAIDNVADKYLGTGLTDAEKEANRFSASQAERARTFEAKQAQIARDWNEEMYEKYNSLSGKIAQAEKAGVNPMFAVTGNAVSPMGTVSGSASSPSPGSVSPSGHGLTDLIGTLMGVIKLKSEIDLNKSQADLNRSHANNFGADTALKERTLKIMNEHNLDVREIESRIGLNTDQATLAFAKAEEAIERCALLTQEKDFNESTKDDRAKIIEYDKLIKEFDASISSAIESLDDGKKRELSDWVGAIFKVLLGIKK